MEKLTKAQKHVLRLIFEDKKPEPEALEEAKISKPVYDGWFRSGIWNREYEDQLSKCQRRANLIIANYKEVAAATLVSLTNCTKEAVARPACLDILGMEIQIEETKKVEKETKLRPETQAAIIKIMADEKKDGMLGKEMGGDAGAG